MKNASYLIVLIFIIAAFTSSKKQDYAFWIVKADFKIRETSTIQVIKVVQAKNEKSAKEKFLSYCRKDSEIKKSPIGNRYSYSDNAFFIEQILPKTILK